MVCKVGKKSEYVLQKKNTLYVINYYYVKLKMLFSFNDSYCYVCVETLTNDKKKQD